MKIFQNKIVVGVICIVIAGLIAFLVLPSINKEKAGTVKIVQFKNDVTAGSKIEENMLSKKEVGSFGLPESVVRDQTQIVGKYVNTDVSKDDYILSSKISDYAANQKLDKAMANGQMLVTVSIDSVAAGVGNHLQSGDIISIIGYADNTVNSYEELRNLEIYSIENDDAQNLDDSKGEDIETIVSSITLIVNQAQAEKLVLAEYSGKVHAVLVKRGA